VGIGVAMLMAWVLYQAEAHGKYYYLFTPLLVGAPVMVAVYGVLHLGKCRNPLIGTCLAVVTMLTYYLGYWQISYQQNVVRHGPVATRFVEQATGLPGAIGYFVFHCRNTRPSTGPGSGRDSEREPTRADEGFNYFFHGLEVTTLCWFAVLAGWYLPRRVFYDDAGRWGRALEVLIARTDQPAILQAVEREDWDAIARLPKLASDGSSRETHDAIRVRFEFLPGGRGQVAYVTIQTTPRSRMAGPVLSWLKSMGSGEVRQRTISPESAVRLAEAFPGQITISSLAASDIMGSRATGALASSVPRQGHGVVSQAVGPVAAPYDAQESRDLAIAESQQFIGNPLSVSQALVFAADVGQITRVRRHNLAFNACILACLAVGLGSAIIMISIMDEDASTPMTPVQVVLSVLFVLGLSAGFLAIFLYNPIASTILTRRLAAREGSLLPAMRTLKRHFLRLSFVSQFHLKEKAIDDLVVCAADQANRRLLVEGVRYRYVIPASAILQLTPLQSGETVALQLDFEVAGRVLQVALARDNIKAHFQHHFWFISSAGDARKLCSRMRKELGLPPLV
jgi:hypothetical protein